MAGKRCFICGARTEVVRTTHRVPKGVTNARGPYTTRYVNKCAECAPFAFGAEPGVDQAAPDSDSAQSCSAPSCDAGYAHSDSYWPEGAV